MNHVEVPTPDGPARVTRHRAGNPHAILLLGHGAGGGIDAPDLAAARRAALEAGVALALVEQPYRVAGRRLPPAAPRLDQAWLAVAAYIRETWAGPLPLIFGGRSSGARVACRTAGPGDAAAVLCLAFPVHPPGRPEKSRQAELSAVRVPTLVVQGGNDPFGRPTPPPGGSLEILAGDHSLKTDIDGVYRTVHAWLLALWSK